MKKLIYILIIIFLFGGMVFRGEEEARAGWYDGSWTYRKAITVQSSKVETTETSFPVLVSVTDPDLKSTGNGGHVSQANGYDIIFTDDDGTSLLDFEIESWNSSTGEIQAWVETDISTTVDKVIYMYYGNSSATDISDAEGVWDINFVMVQHMQEDPTDTSPAFKDSTSNNNDGTDYGDMTSDDQVAGQIDGSLNFDWVDYIHIPSGYTNTIKGDNTNTVEYWVQQNFHDEYGGVHVDMEDDVQGYVTQWDNNNKVIFAAGGSYRTYTPSPAISLGNIYHFAFVKTGTGDSGNLFINGNLQSNYTGTMASMPDIESDLIIGKYHDEILWEFYGVIDEIRISNVARTAGWIETEYNNQNSPSTFLIFGPEEKDFYYLMQSANYKIEKDSINFGGIDGGRSDSYLLNDTMGEVGTGFSESDTYQVSAGYRQMDEEEVLSFSIRNSDETADTNACALGTLSTGSVSTCSYRLKIGSTASAGFQVGLYADDQLNQSTASIDIDDITENFTVAAGTEGHGITVAPPMDNGIMGTATTWTEQSPFDDDDTPIPAGEGNMDVIFASNGTQDVDLYGTGDLDGTTLIMHRAAISTATREGNYDQVVTYVVSSVL